MFGIDENGQCLLVSTASFSPQMSYVCLRVFEFGTILTNSHNGLHRLPALVQLSQIAAPNGFADKFRNGRPARAGARAQCIPKVIVQIELSPPHDV